MAGDWVKMRVWLSKDPKVIRMADYLAEQRRFIDWLTDPVRQSCKVTAYEHVTRNVTVALCVTALGVTWGTAREQGRRENDDLIIDHCNFETLSAMSDLPCFGNAMGAIGWAVELQSGSICFPKFFRDNSSPEDRLRTNNAERQARLRAKRNGKSNVTDNVTSNVTVTHREEKRREEKSKKKKPPFPLLSIPESLDSQEFKDQWERWLKFRVEKHKPVTQTMGEGMLEMLQGLGQRRAIAAIKHTIAMGWQGLREPEGSTVSDKPRPATPEDMADYDPYRRPGE